MKTVCKTDMCAGCMACVDSCGVGAVSIKDTLFAYNAVIDETRCVSCGACEKVCPNNNPVKKHFPLFIRQGWSGDEAVRARASSGGIASELAIAFVKKGGKVAACTFSNGEFVFDIFDNERDLEKIAGSKYVKSNPVGIYKKIKRCLKENNDVLFIGLPCQSAAAKNFVGEKLAERLTAVDLICHGSPSPKVLDAFFARRKTSCEKAESISFRKKSKFGLSAKPIYDGEKNGAVDGYMRTFLSSVSYTENCYSCPYAEKARVSDITLGDSWGSELSVEEQKKGISLILCQTEKGKALLDSANIELLAVDEEKAVARNHQLSHPSVAPKGRTRFLKNIARGRSFDLSVWCALPKDSAVRLVRKILHR